MYFINTDKMHNNKVNSFAELLTLRESERDWSICLLLEIADVFPYWRENSNVSGKRFTSSPSVQYSVDGLNFNSTLECDLTLTCVVFLHSSLFIWNIRDHLSRVNNVYHPWSDVSSVS